MFYFLRMKLQLNIIIMLLKGGNCLQIKTFLPLPGHKVVCSLFPGTSRGKDETLLPWRMMAKLSGTLMEVFQDLISVTELYMSDENVRDR